MYLTSGLKEEANLFPKLSFQLEGRDLAALLAGDGRLLSCLGGILVDRTHRLCPRGHLGTNIFGERCLMIDRNSNFQGVDPLERRGHLHPLGKGGGLEPQRPQRLCPDDQRRRLQVVRH